MSVGARWRRVAEVLAAGSVLVFLVGYLVQNAGAVRAYPWSLDSVRLVAATVLLVGANSAMVALWRSVLARFGGRLSLTDAHRIWYLASLGRYVPGKVLQLAGTGWLVRSKGVPAGIGVGSALVAQAILLVAGTAVAAATLPAGAGSPGLRAGGIVAAATLLALCATPLLDRLVAAVGRRLGRDRRGVELPPRDRVALVLAYAGVWLALGVGFWLFAEGVGVGELPLDATIGIFVAGYLAGYAAIVVPGGLGVREGAYAALLGLYLPGPVAIAVALLARLWSTAVELVVTIGLLARFGLGDLRTPLDPAPGKR